MPKRRGDLDDLGAAGLRAALAAHRDRSFTGTTLIERVIAWVNVTVPEYE